MKLLSKILFILSVFGFASCNTGEPKTMELSIPLSDFKKDTISNIVTSIEKNTNPWDTVLLGDIDNDKQPDTVFVLSPETIEEELSCKDSVCSTLFVFSNKKYPVLLHEQALGGSVSNAGDIDGDGICELCFVPDWFTSNWTSLNVYSLKEGKWFLLGEGSIRRDVPEMESDLYTPYSKRIIKHKGYFEILENSMDGDGNERLVPKKINLNK